MKTVGDKLNNFVVTGVKPGALTPDAAFEDITDLSFEGKWKVIVFYPKDFTFVCPTEIVAYDKLNKDFADRDAVLLIGSTDNEFCKLAWKNAHEDLKKTTSWFFADTQRDLGDNWGESANSLVEQLGVFFKPAGAALRATLIVDRALSAKHDDIVVAVIDSDFTVKRLYCRNKRLALIAENPAYPPIVIGDEQELSIWGVVTAWIVRPR